MSEKNAKSVPRTFLQDIAASALYPALLGAGLVGAMVRFLEVFADPSFSQILAELRDPRPWLLLCTVGYLGGMPIVNQFTRKKSYGLFALILDLLEVAVLFFVLASTGVFSTKALELPLYWGYSALAFMPLFGSVSRMVAGNNPRPLAYLVFVLCLAGAVGALCNWPWLITIAQLGLWVALWFWLLGLKEEWSDGESGSG